MNKNKQTNKQTNYATSIQYYEEKITKNKHTIKNRDWILIVSLTNKNSKKKQSEKTKKT